VESPDFRPQGPKTPELIDMKLDMNDYVEDSTPRAKFGAPALPGAGLHMHEVVDPPVYIFYARYFFISLRNCTDHPVRLIFVVNSS